MIQRAGPVSRMDDSNDPWLEHFIAGSAEEPIELVRQRVVRRTDINLYCQAVV
ncbi:MAG: hypothetical protein AAF408_11250 [Pseudomonadota bacterium]